MQREGRRPPRGGPHVWADSTTVTSDGHSPVMAVPTRLLRGTRQSTGGAVRAAAKRAGTPQYTPKSFRHFFVPEAIHAQIPLFEVAVGRSSHDSDHGSGVRPPRPTGHGSRRPHDAQPPGTEAGAPQGPHRPALADALAGDVEDWDDVA
jgi:hypothetical protein